MTASMPSARRVTALVVHLVALAIVVTGCAFEPSDVPIPGTTVSGDTYPIEIRFSNVLNLPPGAKVIANGVEVGNLTGLDISDPDGAGEGGTEGGYVAAKVKIKESVKLPTGTLAELRQATPLGDVHIALTTPQDAGQADLEPNGVIPLTQTSQAPQIEDTMAGLSTAISGGTIQSFQDIVRQMNAVLPTDPVQTANTFAVLGQDLQDLAGNLDSVDSLLDGLHATSQVFVDNREKLNAMLTDEGLAHVVSVFGSVLAIIIMLTQLGPIAKNAVWLAPLVQGLDDSAKAVVPVLFMGNPLDLSTPSNLSKLVDLIQDKLIPFAQMGPKVNVSVAQVSPAGAAISSTDKTDQIIDVLRMIGAVR